MSTLGGGMCSACCHIMALVSAIKYYAFIVFVIKYFFLFFYNSLLNLVLKRQTETVNVTSITNFMGAIFYNSNTKGTNFWIYIISLKYCVSTIMYYIYYIINIHVCFFLFFSPEIIIMVCWT